MKDFVFVKHAPQALHNSCQSLLAALQRAQPRSCPIKQVRYTSYIHPVRSASYIYLGLQHSGSEDRRVAVALAYLQMQDRGDAVASLVCVEDEKHAAARSMCIQPWLQVSL